MSKYVRVSALVMAVVLTIAMSATAAAAADPARPFRGTITGSDTMGPPACPGASWQYSHSGTGQLAHLGLVTAEITHCTWFDPDSMTGTFGPGTITFTDATGDQLVVADWGTFTVVPAAQASFVDLHWEVIDGTGRFEGASGSGGGAPVSDLVAGTTTATYWGSLSY